MYTHNVCVYDCFIYVTCVRIGILCNTDVLFRAFLILRLKITVTLHPLKFYFMIVTALLADIAQKTANTNMLALNATLNATGTGRNIYLLNVCIDFPTIQTILSEAVTLFLSFFHFF